MNKSLIAAVAAAASLLAAGTAQAGNVHWSIGISLPPVATVISNAPAPVYAPAPVVYAPPPVVYAPPPVVYSPPPVVYTPPPRVVYPAPVVVGRPVPIVYGYPHYGHRDRDRDGIPRGWVQVMREAIRSNAPRFSTRRMVKEYVNLLYLPAMLAEALEPA